MFKGKNWPKKHTLTASVLPHDTNPFHSVYRKDMQCSESHTGGFYAYFGGDPFTNDARHDSFMHSVLFRMGQPCDKFYAVMVLRAVCT